MKFQDLYAKYKDLIPYAIFGVLTTLVNIIVYWLCAHPFHLPVLLSTVIAWVLSVLFAYVTNRKWVFHSEAKGRSAILKEITSFFSCRLATGVLDGVSMFVFVDLLKLNDMAVKVIANIVVIIINYLASKLVIFKHKEG